MPVITSSQAHIAVLEEHGGAALRVAGDELHVLLAAQHTAVLHEDRGLEVLAVRRESPEYAVLGEPRLSGAAHDEGGRATVEEEGRAGELDVTQVKHGATVAVRADAVVEHGGRAGLEPELSTLRVVDGAPELCGQVFEGGVSPNVDLCKFIEGGGGGGGGKWLKVYICLRMP